MVASFKSGDLVWAKMKGFPPWPASVTSCPKILRDGTTSQGKYTVTFFGTKETAQMKAPELFPYMEHRLTFEKNRKVKGFNEGIKEIRIAAGLEGDETASIQGRTRQSSRNAKEVKISPRIRKPSSRIPTDEFVLSPSRTRAASKSDNQNTSAIKSPIMPPSVVGIKRSRLRTESNCSNASTGSATKRSKRVSYSDKHNFDFGLDLDPLLNTGMEDVLSFMDDQSHEDTHSLTTDSVFLNATLDANALFMDEQPPQSSSTATDEAPTEKRRARRRTRSRFLDDLLMSPGKSPFRDRSRSISSNGGRSRLISNYSDTFEDFLDSAHSIFNPNDLMAAIDQLPSEDSDRPITPEEPLPMPAPLKTCYSCGCQCELLGLKWRCTSKLCMKWNGTHKPYPVGSNSEAEEEHPEKSSEQLEIEKAVNAIKEEASNFEEEFNQQQQLRRQVPDQPNLIHYNQPEPQFEQRFDHIRAPTTSANNYANPNNSAGMAIKSELSHSFDQFDSFGHSNDSLQYYSSVGGASANCLNRRNTSVASSSAQLLSEIDFGGRKKSGRPKSYKVEKTPPIRADGRRLCALCSGEVRPQMCGGNKHRWRCVDKKCRKWYGWVLSCDEIPMDLGKKGRWKDLVVKVRQPGNPYDEDAFAANTLSAHLTQQPKRIGRPPKVFMEDDPNRDKIRTKFPPAQGSDPRFRRKYTRKKRDDEIEIQRPISPLTLRQMSYEPSAIERHSRWWLSTKRRTNNEMSPPRDFPTSVFSNAATLRLIGSAMLSASDSRADEPGTVDGTLDLLMDSLISSMAPLLSLVNKLPGIILNNEHSETIQKLWKASSVHTPMF